MKKTICLMFVLMLFSMDGVLAQNDDKENDEKTPQFLSPSFAFSRKKTSYITLKDGTELKGNYLSAKFKKGLIMVIKFADGEHGVRKIAAADIEHMYLMPTNLDKLSKKISFFEDIKNWNNQKLEQDLIGGGYVYFESVDVMVKKKKMTMLMQLLNPAFSAKVKIYHDPRAKETASIGVGGLTLAGGYAKSYYIMKDTDKTAFLIKKGVYKKEYSLLWKGCDVMKTDDVSWYNLIRDILKYTDHCK